MMTVVVMVVVVVVVVVVVTNLVMFRYVLEVFGRGWWL